MAYKAPTPGYVYVISDGTNFKIGVSTEPEERLRGLQTANPQKLTLEFCEYKNEPYKVEKVVHRALNKYRGNGEWFSGCTFHDIRIALMLCTEYD